MSFAQWPWITLLLLGAWHGINPGMGWLFAVAFSWLGHTWINVDLIWCCSLLAAGTLLLFVPIA
jgi:hypothetical protein